MLNQCFLPLSSGFESTELPTTAFTGGVYFIHNCTAEAWKTEG